MILAIPQRGTRSPEGGVSSAPLPAHKYAPSRPSSSRVSGSVSVTAPRRHWPTARPYARRHTTYNSQSQHRAEATRTLRTHYCDLLKLVTSSLSLPCTLHHTPTIHRIPCPSLSPHPLILHADPSQ
ncbi:hypothetical protein E2C01_052419 [Portunus trituberculatus]|uniref:Uncharacterized protein n=1 Tax=Portunus trituberculatus TaxID=210409 RepID=A0A5B7GPA7_PORTR|nr:hypothetical protein [Portunus trituberculatus]